MTAIATDGKSMACDGLCTGGGVKHAFNIRKVVRLKSGSIAGFSGSIYHYAVAVAFLNGDTDAIDLGDDGFEAIILHNNGKIECMDGKGRRYEQSAPAVTGSGGAIALGAMLAGASPLDAVEIAASVEQGCGGECYALEPITPALQAAA